MKLKISMAFVKYKTAKTATKETQSCLGCFLFTIKWIFVIIQFTRMSVNTILTICLFFLKLITSKFLLKIFITLIWLLWNSIEKIWKNGDCTKNVTKQMYTKTGFYENSSFSIRQAFLRYIRNLKILQYFRTKLMHLPWVIQATQ